MTFRTTLLVGTVLGVALATGGASAQANKRAAEPYPTPAAPAATQAQIDTLTQQLQALQNQIQQLKTQVTKDVEAVDKKVASMPTVSLSNGRPTLATAKKDFEFALRGRMHLDYGTWFPGNNAGDLPDGFNFRRLYLGFSGKFFNDFTYTLTGNFAGRGSGTGTLYEASIQYLGFKDWSIDVGAYQPTWTFEDSMSSGDLAFVERASAVNLATSNVSSDSRLAIGARRFGQRYYAAAYVTGNQIGAADGIDDQAAVLGRAAVLASTGPEHNLHLGASAGYLWRPSAAATPNAARNISLSDRPETRLGGGGVRFINTGSIDSDDLGIYGAEIAATYKSFWTQAEYYRYEVSRRNSVLPNPHFDGYYIAAGWFLTGERRPYNMKTASFGAPKVSWPFITSGGYGPGAWELVARYSKANLNYRENLTAAQGGIRGGDQEVWTVGVTWYLNNALKVLVNYNIIDVQKLTATGGNGNIDSEALTARLAFTF